MSKLKKNISFKYLREVLGKIAVSLPQVRLRKKNGLTVFIFHSVTDSPGVFEVKANLVVSIDLFKKQISWILRNYQPIDPKSLEGMSNLPSEACLITFDDGWAGAFENAFPILERYSVPFLMFLNTDSLDKACLSVSTISWLTNFHPQFDSWMSAVSSVWNKDYPDMCVTPSLFKRWEAEMGPSDIEAVKHYQGELATWRHVSEWDGHPLVHYGNHLFNHWNAKLLSNDELRENFVLAQEKIDRLKSGTSHFAFPFGSYLPYQIPLLRSLGASHIYLTEPHVNKFTGNKNVFGRINISPWDDQDALMEWEVTRVYWEGFLGKNLVGKIRNFAKLCL